jgi:hypothetical protein
MPRPWLPLLLLFSMLVIPSLTIGSEAAHADAPEGFEALFNGVDLAGWKGLVADPKQRAEMSAEELAAAQVTADERMREHWRVVDGALEVDADGENLCTAKDYGNFELYVDWKILPGGDSGIYLRGTPQIQIWDPADESAWKHGSDKGSGAIWNNKRHSRFPLVKADRPVGQWNTFYIRMIGDRVTVKLNGQLVVDNEVMENYWDPNSSIAARGPIELQCHGNFEGNIVWFRDIYIRELP